MRKTSLSQLSKNNLDKIQQRALTGGGQDQCICTWLNCYCGCFDISNSILFSISEGQQIFFAELDADVSLGPILL